MRRASKALVVPLIAVAIWALPRDRPNVEVASAAPIGAIEVEALAAVAIEITSDPPSSVAPTVVTMLPPSTLVTTTTSTATTSSASTSTTIATTSSASTTTSTSPPPSSEGALGQQALSRVSFDWRAAFPNWTVEFKGPRSGIRALTYPAEKRVEIFVRVDDTAESLHRVFAHELGHVIDVEYNTENERFRWMEQRGIDSQTPWWPSAESPDFATGAGDFAEAFAVLETGVTTRSTIGKQPTTGDLELLRELARG